MRIATTFIALLILSPLAFAQEPTTAPAIPAPATPIRALRYPPKTARTLHTDAEIALARENIKKYPAAKKLADDIIQSADEWASWKDEDLIGALTSPEVPRAFAVSASGCPVCGDKIKTKGGDYAWIIDPKQPFKVKCPIDGTVFPTNDYESFYRSGFKEKKNWTGDYIDDGRGWVDPKTGEKFWFVAYFNHWMWHKHLVLGLRDLGNAYLLTGDKKYAHKAAVMLHRVAEVYPGMDHAKQSRYGEMMAARGIVYPGKVVNAIWETQLAQNVADAYDAVFETIDADIELQRETRQTGSEIRSFIEANFLEDAIDAVFADKIRGNFGMHQSTLVHLTQVRQTGENDKWFDYLLNESSADPAVSGLNYALYNLISRDGVPSETSPGYNFLWVAKIAEYGDLLQRAGRDIFGIPRTRRLFDAVIDQVNAGQFTPDLGDTQTVYGGLTGAEPQTFLTAYRYFKDPRYLAFIAKRSKDINFKTVNALFREPVDVPKDATLLPAKSRLFDGYGLAILNDPADKTSLSLYYGQKHGHGHFDRLGFELFANGQPIMPDLGYPDAMNDFVPGIYTWSKNTISHNTVVVDQKRQAGNIPGEVKLFADSPFARVVDIEAKGTYPQCSSYRRAMIMVDVGEGNAYYIDIFTVAGGDQHDYSLHGPPGEFEMIGGKWSDPAKGTLAGENVALAEIYDDPKLSGKDYKGGFSSYGGSGFQHLFNVRTQEQPGWVAQWKHEKDPHSMLRIRVLDQPDTKIMQADAHVSPAKYPQILKYLIARRQGNNVSSRFVSVIEPFKDKPFIENASISDDGDILIARTDHSRDIIHYSPENGVTIRTIDGTAAQRQLRAFAADASKGLKAAVTQVDPRTSSVTIALPDSMPGDKPEASFDPTSLVGRVVHLVNARHRSAHTVASAQREGKNLILSFSDDIVVGLAKIDAMEPNALTTSTALPLAPTYVGTTLADEHYTLLAPVKSVGDGKINLGRPLPANHALKPGSRVWLLDVGVGDRLEVPLVTYSDSEKKP